MHVYQVWGYVLAWLPKSIKGILYQISKFSFFLLLLVIW
ncbi:hypothetical protein F383_22649 [Gossypium arboreum]|uniref:Uncharacterized protein n=1 Tax=Gossypium arboreum TaxID=29729 RepID=A0A0B0NWP3_GOSAR|nr:hypothetical protein F383_22649 [Gossypium arboreum]